MTSGDEHAQETNYCHTESSHDEWGALLRLFGEVCTESEYTHRMNSQGVAKGENLCDSVSKYDLHATTSTVMTAQR